MRHERQRWRSARAWALPRTTRAMSVPGSAVLGRDIAHGDRAANRVGPKPPLVTTPMVRPSLSWISVPSTGRRPPLRPYPHQRARWTVDQLLLNDLGPRPGKPPSSRRRLPIAQTEPGLDRRDLLGQLVAVEAKPRLQAEAVARAEADRQNAFISQQTPRQVHRVAGGDRDLESVLAGIAEARDAHRRHRRQRGPPRSA